MGTTHLPLVTAGALFTRWQFDPVMAAFCLLLAAGYLTGVRRVLAAGGEWPARRTVLFLAGGVGGLAVFTMSGIAVYDRVLFWAAAIQYSLLLALVPVLLALGEPLALLLVALPPDAAERARRILHGRAVQVLTFPLVSAVLAVATQFALFFTPYFVASLRSNVLHELLYGQLLLTGCLFTLPILGAEVLPAWCTYPLRTLFAGVDGLLDAIPGIVVMTSSTVIAQRYYTGLHLPWLADLQNNQQIGGGLMMTIAEVIGLPFTAVLFVGWFRYDRATAAAADHELDARAELGWPIAPTAEGIASGETDPDRMRPWWEVEAGAFAAHPGWRRRPGGSSQPD